MYCKQHGIWIHAVSYAHQLLKFMVLRNMYLLTKIILSKAKSPYSATKIGSDRMAESFYRSFETPVTIVRPFNTYGPRQSARAVIPTIITQLLAGKEEIKLGSISPTRDFNYVKDTRKWVYYFGKGRQRDWGRNQHSNTR